MYDRCERLREKMANNLVLSKKVTDLYREYDRYERLREKMAISLDVISKKVTDLYGYSDPPAEASKSGGKFQLRMQAKPSDYWEKLNAEYYTAISPLLANCGSDYRRQQPDKEFCVMLMEGLVLLKMSRYDEAHTVFQRCAEYAECNGLLGDISHASLCLGEVELLNRDPGSAAEHFQKALEYLNYPTSAQKHLGMPKVSRCAVHSKKGLAEKNHRRLGDALVEYKLALSAVDSTRDDDPTPTSDIAAAHINLGNILHSIGDHTAAVSHYKQGITLSEECGDMVSYAWAHGNLGNTYLSLSQHKEALHYLQRSLELTLIHEPVPTAIGRAHNNLGTYYQAVGDLDTAQYHYDTALAQAVYGQDIPGQACAYGNIGKMHLLRNDQERAITYCTEKLRLSHDGTTVTDAYHNRGCAYFELGEKLRLEQTRTRDSCQQIVVRQPVCMLESENQMVSVSCKPAVCINATVCLRKIAPQLSDKDFDAPAVTTSATSKEGGGTGGGWDDDEWEDFSKPAQPPTNKPSSHMSSSTTTTSSSLSAGQGMSKAMKLGSTRTPSPALFDDTTSWGRGTATTTSNVRKDKTPPPPVPLGLFDVKDGGGGGGGGGGEGWGDWDDDDITTSPATPSSKSSSRSRNDGKPELKSKEVPFFTMETTNDPGDSWGFDNGWGATTTNTTSTIHSSSSSSSSSSTGATSRQELLQKRREERRLKQQAAREKRSAGMSLKPSGLGVAKKDF